MIDEVIKVFKKIDAKDYRILTGIETGMKHFEWVPIEELNKYTKTPFDKLEYRLRKLVREKLVVRTTQPYEGYQIYFEGYDALALNAFVKRKSISAIGDEIGVGKESVILEAIRQPELAIGKPFPVIIKFHREGRTSFKQIKRVREHIGEREHFSWIYAARLAAQRLSKTRLLNAEWYLDEILRQVKITYSLGIIHADLSEYNIFVSEDGVQLIDWPQYITPAHPQADEILERDVSNVLVHFNRKYGIKRDLEEVIGEIKSAASLIKATEEEGRDEEGNEEVSRDEEGNEEISRDEEGNEEAIIKESHIEGTGKRRGD